MKTGIAMRPEPTAPPMPPLRLPAAVLDTLSRLRGVVPDATDEATAWLEHVLAPLAASQWPEAAWRFSRLTNTGMPVEFAWSSRDAAVRWPLRFGAAGGKSGHHHAPTFRIDIHGRAGASARPACSNSIEMPSGERTNAMRPSRRGRLMVPPCANNRSHAA